LDINEGNGAVDTDGDGVPDSLDIDSDDDGNPDIVEAQGGDPGDVVEPSGQDLARRPAMVSIQLIAMMMVLMIS